MPSSYQAPMRQDRKDNRTKSQSVNLHEQNASVGDILEGKGNNVFTITADETLGRAVEELRDRRIGALIVADAAGKLEGILSERDIVRKLADTPGQTLPQRVGDIMTRKVETCGPNDPIVSVLKRMSAGRFRHMPVLEGETLIGMITIGDAITHRLTQLEHESLQLKQLIVG